MTSDTYKMSVRGSKNKIIIYVAGVCSIVFAILLYHNASQRLEAMEISYERCHLNEESLSAQLQVNLEYKIRLEKSLQQEKSDHAQTKEELQKKLEDERHTRERENLESIDKFSALKEQCNFMQHDYDVVKDSYKKLKQLQLSEVKDKKHLEEVVENMKKELSLLKEIKSKDSDNWKVKLSALEHNNSALQEQNKILTQKIENYEKTISSLDVKLAKNIPPSLLSKNSDGSQLHLPNYPKDRNLPLSGILKSSTPANRLDKELFPSANVILANISTPVINPQAVQNEERIQVSPVPQPRQESSSMRDPSLFDEKENVAPKPEEAPKEGPNGMVQVQDVLRAPDLLNRYVQVPEVQNRKKQFRESEKNNHAGEVHDEDDGLVNNVAQNQMNNWRENEFVQQPLVINPMDNEILKKSGYHYVAEEEGRKEEGEDDDDDPIESDWNLNMKNNELKENVIKPIIQMPFGGKHDSVMLQPK